MSAGHPHTRTHTKTPAELDRVLQIADTPALMKRPLRFDSTKDVPDTGGYSVDGLEQYLDRTFMAMLRSGQIVLAGVTNDQIVHAILLHEHTEKAILDANNNIDDYKSAHEYATVNEHRFISQFTTPKAYEDAIRKGIVHVEHKVVTAPPVKLACAPYLDEPDKNDLRVLGEMRKLGVIDATKESKLKVSYGDGDQTEHCGICTMFRPLGQPELATCTAVEGTVRKHKWCKRFAKMPVSKPPAPAEQQQPPTQPPPPKAAQAA